MSHELLTDLEALLGPSGVLIGADAAAYQSDWRNLYRGNALAVVRPGSTAEVAETVRQCAQAGVAIVPQGGNTGLSGGAIALGERSSVVLSLARMNTIEDVNPAQSTMTVQAGVTIQAMQEAAAEVQRKFAPDWGARGTATIGGGIATDAGGTNVLRYGNMREQILGLEAVTAEGRVWDGLRALRKDSSGYDLKQLFIGAEGTLGVVTRAVVKLVPATPHVQSGLAALSSLDHLAAFFDLALNVAPDTVTAFELMPQLGLQRACDLLGFAAPLETSAEFSVLLKLAGTRPVLDRLAELFARAAEAAIITDAVVASSPEQEERLWALRDELSPVGIFPLQRHGIKMDTAVPIDRIAEFHTTVRRLAAELAPAAVVHGFGHVGDGNIHMYVLPHADDAVEEFLKVRPELQRRIDQATFDLGGTLSAEHGIGVELAQRIGAQKGATEVDLMATIKTALDPHNIMNPGKMLPRSAP